MGINPNPPAVSICWHDSPEDVHRLMWEPVAISEGMTYDEMLADSTCCGETEDGQLVEFSHEQELGGMRAQGCWAFADTHANTIHAWAAPDADRGRVLHMLAHEIGHLTGEPHEDSMQEELRAEQFGRVAALAFSMLVDKGVA